VRIFNRSTVQAFAADHRLGKEAVWRWHRLASGARWTCFQDVRLVDPTVSMVGDRLIFNLNGNRFRLIARVDWSAGFLFIRFIGTHADYNRINAQEI